METSTNRCLTRTLGDSPAQSDAFGSHATVAHAIADVIINEEGGKAISLTGTWGSGKSSVIKFLVDILSPTGKDSKNRVFVFDAWSHQGDPLRRSFLESLVNNLDSAGWIKKVDWQTDLDRINRKIENTTTVSEPVLTFYGRLVMITTLFVPVGYVFLQKLDSGIKVYDVDLWLLGLFLVLFPVLVVTSIWLIWRPTWRFWEKRFWKENRFPHTHESLTTVFVHKTREKNETKTIKTPDPTSIEFKEIFSRLLDKILGINERRIIFVIDNLDRIDPEEALKIWATMRVFFESENISDSIRKNVWLLVPFDPIALKRLWKSSDNANNGLVASFVDKTFQLTFRVSPPILSDWKTYLYDMLKQAFPDHSPTDDFDSVYRLFKTERADKEPFLTPRDIKLFVNKVGNLHRQWCGIIPLPMQALYILYSNRINNAQSDLLSEKFLDERIINVLEIVEWQKYLAALHFNVPPEKALQVLIGKRVEDVLTNFDIANLEQLKGISGFFNLCQDILEKTYNEWANSNPDFLASSAELVGTAKGSVDGDWNLVWRWIHRGIVQIQNWRSISDKVANGIISAIENCQPQEKQLKLVESILLSISKTELKGSKEGEEPSAEEIRRWIKGIIRLIRYLHSGDHNDLIQKFFRLPGSPHVYLRSLSELATSPDNESIIRYFNPKSEAFIIVEKFSRSIKEGPVTTDEIKILDCLARIDIGWNWEQIAGASNERLESSNTLDPDEIASCAAILLKLSYRIGHKEASKALDQLANSNKMFFHLHHANNSENPRAAAYCLFTIVEKLPEGNPQVRVKGANNGISLYNDILANPENHPKIIDEFYSIALEYSKTESLLQSLSDHEMLKPLISSTFKRISVLPNAWQHIKSTSMISHFEFLSKELPQNDFPDLVNDLVENDELVTSLLQSPFSRHLANLYLLCLSAPSPKKKAGSLNEFLRIGFQAMPHKEWLEELEEESAILRILLHFINANIDIDLTEDYSLALREHGRKVQKGQLMPSVLNDQWRRFLVALADHWRDNVMMDMWDDLIKEPENNLSNFVLLYGTELFKTNLDESRFTSIVRLVFTKMLERKNKIELNWIDQSLREHHEIMSRCPSAILNVFRDRVEELLKASKGEEIEKVVETLARTLGLNLEEIGNRIEPEKKPEDNAVTT